MIALPESIAVHEVGPRDGLQSFPRRIPTDVKVAMVDLLSELGFPLIEVTNFAHPKMIPNLDDAEEVMRRIKRRPGTIYRGQAPNNRGAERAVAANVDEILGLITVSEVYLKKNQNMTMERAIDEAILAFNTSDAAGKRFTMALGHTMWCPFEGLIPEASVYALLDKFYAAGMRSFYLAGSMGMEEPRHVGRLFAQCVRAYPGAAFGYHVHNMSGLASANVLAALEAGATSLEGSICGIGGGIRTPKAEGNMPTEDIVHMMSLLGIRTGIDLESIVAASRSIGEMLDFTPTSYVTLNGTRASAQVREVVPA